MRVGCAGWSLGSTDRDRFGLGDSLLQRYATRLELSEINSSFYRPHKPATYERWAARVPSGFRFTAKVPKAITHDARLRGTGVLLDRFIDEVSALGRTFGGLVVQLAPSHALEPRVADTFFAMLRRRTRVPVGCEPRHASWYGDAAARISERHAIHRIAADPPRPADAIEPAGAGPVRYWRLHGSPRIYWSGYDDDALQAFAARVHAWAAAWHDCDVILDNTAGGRAFSDALRLRELIEELARGAKRPARGRKSP